MSPAGCSHVNGYKVDNWKQNLRVIYQCFVWSGTAETRRRKVKKPNGKLQRYLIRKTKKSEMFLNMAQADTRGTGVRTVPPLPREVRGTTERIAVSVKLYPCSSNAASAKGLTG